MDGTRFFDIPYDLIEKIILRLDLKALKRLSFVNKTWYNLIHSSYFISKHYSYNSFSNVKILVNHFQTRAKTVMSLLSKDDEDCSLLDVSIPFLNYHETSIDSHNISIDIIGSCINGIICQNIAIWIDREDDDDLSSQKLEWDFALWNIATREYHLLPKLNLPYTPNIKPWIEGLGFGWVPDTNDYKIIISIVFSDYSEIPNYGSDTDEYLWSLPSPILIPDPEVYVYNLTTNSWKQITYPGECRPVPQSHQVYVSGFCYWVNHVGVGTYKILSFHVRDEVFGTLELPHFEIREHSHYWPTLSIFDGCIALVINIQSFVDRNYRFDIWVMEEESWINKFQFGPFHNIRVGLGFVKDEFFARSENDELFSISSNSHEVKYFGRVNGKSTLDVFEYVESLVSIKRHL